MSDEPPLPNADDNNLLNYSSSPSSSSSLLDDYPTLTPATTTNDEFALHRLVELHQDLAPLLATSPSALNDKDHWGQAPLHLACFSRNLSGFVQLVEAGADLSRRCQGSPLAHVVVAVGGIEENEPFAIEALGVLLKHQVEALVSPQDEYGRTPLRLACELGLPLSAMRVLLDAGDKVEPEVKKQAFAAEDRVVGHTALHALVESPSAAPEVLAELLARGLGEVVNATDARGRTALQLLALATGRADGPCFELLVAAGAQDAEAAEQLAAGALAARERRGPTLVMQHPVCLEHLTCPLEHTDGANLNSYDVPPENVNRLHVLLDDETGTLNTSRLRRAGLAVAEAPRAEIGDIVRVHDWGYLRTLMKKCADMGPTELDSWDGDTVISGMTFEASLFASGAAIAAVDAVFGGHAENVFCAVRPPGHHAGPCGLVPGCTSHGFCMVNNVAVAAAYALNVHRGVCGRVAIVDFDVHHGNGTEVCINHLQSSTELDEQMDLPNGLRIKVSQPAFKPWLGERDFENVLFCSVHGWGKTIPGLELRPGEPPSFYPASGASTGWKEGSVLNYGQNSHSRQEWRHAWNTIVLPRVEAFKPDLILVSAGFDAHAKDGINAGYCGAIEADYYWLTKSLVGLANQVCEGRLVSVLEGGYRIEGRNVSAFARSVHDHVLAMAEARTDVGWDQVDIEEEPRVGEQVVFEADEGRRLGNRRQRTQVDYVKLNEELSEAKKSKLGGDSDLDDDNVEEEGEEEEQEERD